MTGRGGGLPARGRSTQQPPPLPPLIASRYSIFDSNRGRGRPRKFPLTSTPRIPPSSGSSVSSGDPHQHVDVIEDSEEFRGEVVEDEEPHSSEYYQHDDVGEHHQLHHENMNDLVPEEVEEIVEEEVVVEEGEMVEEIEEVGEVVDSAEMKKIKQIQHQKMRLVTPMAQKRHRGRPPTTQRSGSSNLLADELLEDDEEEMLMLDQNPSESGPLADLPSDSHQNSSEINSHPADHPPPAPRHLLNKANSRGRPANPIPPHRRPLPKDLVPPGASSLKRGMIGSQGPLSKRRINQNFQNKIQTSEDVPPLLHPPRGGSISHLIPNQEQQAKSGSQIQGPKDLEVLEENAIKQEALEEGAPEDDGGAPEAIEEVVISQEDSEDVTSSSATARIPEKKAGLDLPAEHFPKDPAGHVATRGIHPVATEKISNHLMTYEQVVMEPHESMDMDHMDPQQRVLTLQGGSFIDDRIGRADLMEDEETRMIAKNSGFITVQEEDGMNVVYQVEDHGEILDAGDVNEEYVIQNPREILMDSAQMKENMIEEEDDDDLPPQLIPEGVPDDGGDGREGEEGEHEKEQEMSYEFGMLEDGQYQFCHSDGRQLAVRVVQDQDGNSLFIDEQGQIVDLITDTGARVDPSQMGPNDQIRLDDGGVDVKTKNEGGGEEDNGPAANGRVNLEFMNSCNFLDSNNICCGLCGEIVLYDKLISEHLPNAHPETQTQDVQLEEVPYHSWLKDRLRKESKMLENGFRQYEDHDNSGFGGAARLYQRSMKQMRKVSQIRVNVNEMTMVQLENALKRKLIEKMGRKVPVSLVDRLHARCDICQAVVSLNKKFEVVHLVRHFNAWHPAEHRCTQEWKDAPNVANPGSRRPLSLHDFAVVSTDTDQNNLQCIWCGMLMDRAALGMHFSEIHTQQILVPNCSLCLQEMVMTARLMEKYGEDFGISLPDEFHLMSAKLGAKYSSEKSMDKAIDKYLKRSQSSKPPVGVNQQDQDEMAEDQVEDEDDQTISITNSQQSFGRRNRLKRKFVKPCFRQTCPTNSEFFIAKSACEWRCRLCDRNVYGAVISAGAIKHFKEFHPADIDKMQYELVKARLERIGDGSMEFVHPQLVECLICSLTYALHKPFNICRAIRHLRLKHPEVMPETSGKSISGAEVSETTNLQKPAPKRLQTKIRFGEVITDPIELEKFRKENYDQQFDKVQVVYGIKKNDEPAYILLMENEQMDEKTAMEMAQKLRADEESAEDVVPRLLNPEETSEGVYRGQEGEEDVVDVKPMLVENYQDSGELEQEGVEEDAYVATYDANNPDHVLIEENEILGDENYEMIQEGDEYQDLEEDSRTVRYLTEEEIREAQARGEILEFEEEVFEEEDYTGQ